MSSGADISNADCDSPDCENPKRMGFLDTYLTVCIPGAMLVGPLIEVPVLIAFVNVARSVQGRFDWRGYTTGRSEELPLKPTEGGN